MLQKGFPQKKTPTIKVSKQATKCDCIVLIPISYAKYKSNKVIGKKGFNWYWHKENLSRRLAVNPGKEVHIRDDYKFIDTLIQSLLNEKTHYNHGFPNLAKYIDNENIYMSGHSTSGHFIYSFVLGGPPDIKYTLMDHYTIRAIAPSGAVFRKGIFETDLYRVNIDALPNITSQSYNNRINKNLPSVLHVQGEQDTALWYTGGSDCQLGNIEKCSEPDKTKVNFIWGLNGGWNPNNDRLPEIWSIDTTKKHFGVLTRKDGDVYPAWNEKDPTLPSTLQQLANKLDKDFINSVRNETKFFKEYYYNFVDNSQGLSPQKN